MKEALRRTPGRLRLRCRLRQFAGIATAIFATAIFATDVVAGTAFTADVTLAASTFACRIGGTASGRRDTTSGLGGSSPIATSVARVTLTRRASAFGVGATTTARFTLSARTNRSGGGGAGGSIRHRVTTSEEYGQKGDDRDRSQSHRGT